MPDLVTTLGGQACKLSGSLQAIPVRHGLGLVSIPCSDGLTEVAYEATTSDRPTVVVFVAHSFSGNELEITIDPAMTALLSMPNAAIVCPRLFGVAGNPNTCGSPIQLAHMLDVINWMKARYGISKVWMAGVSGGAGLGPTFIGAYPGVVSRASFWCGYNDLAAWYGESVAAGHVYNQLMDEAFGGPPTGALAEVYLAQSPKGRLPGAKDCTIYINSGLLDADIPPHHSADMAAELTGLPGVTCNYITYPSMGHTIDWPAAVAQLQA